MNTVATLVGYAAKAQGFPFVAFVSLRRGTMRSSSNGPVIGVAVTNRSQQFGVSEGHVWFRRNGAQLAEHALGVHADTLVIHKTADANSGRVGERERLFIFL